MLLCCVSEPLAAGEDSMDWVYGHTTPTATESDAIPQTLRSQPPVKKVVCALAVVLGVFFLVSLLWRQQSTAQTSHQMLEPLGSVPITPKVNLHLVRFGRRILVLHIAGQNVQRVAEVKDPEEVQHLLASHQETTASVSVSELLRTMDPKTQALLKGHVQ